MNLQEKQFEKILDELKLAIKMKNKQGINDCYDKAKKFDFFKISNALLKEYDELIDKGNLILLQD